LQGGREKVREAEGGGVFAGEEKVRELYRELQRDREL